MKNYFKRLAFAALLFTTSITVKAQYYQNVQGTPIKEYRGDGAEGSPYMSDNWATGSASIEKGTYNNIKLKYDLKNDIPVFAGKDDVPMGFAEPVKTFVLNGKNFANGFPAIGAQDKNSYYQILSDGKTKLLKHYAKRIQESKTYGSNTLLKEYIATEAYYVFKDNKMSLIKPDKKAVLEFIGDKSAQVDEYVKTNKVNFKNDASLAQLFDYYNSL